MAAELGLAHRTYQNYERDERLPDADCLARLVGQGWNANWLLTGDGPERGESVFTGISGASQPLRDADLRMAVQLAQEALDGWTLPPAQFAELVTLIYDALVHGLPSAQVIALARPAARGLRKGVEDGGSAMGGSGTDAAGDGESAA